MFKGVFTAIITPFKKDSSIDWDSLKNLVEFQIQNKVTGIIPCGTTGESPTLSHEEHDKVIERAIEYADGRCTIIAGTGSNATSEAIRLTKHAADAGADACLLVSPYYNKPTQEGLYRHFKAVADLVDIPLILYNIKGRTAVNIETQTLMRLIKHCKNILGVKEASGDITQINDVIKNSPKNFSILSGDDNMTLEVIKAGGHGVISVAANIIPARMVAMVDAALNKNYNEAEKLNSEMHDFFKGEYIETNPIPIKAAMAMKGFCREIYRLPLCEMQPDNRQRWKKILEQMGIIYR